MRFPLFDWWSVKPHAKANVAGLSGLYQVIDGVHRASAANPLLILIAATGNRYEVALLFHSDLVSVPPIFPPFITSMTAIDSCDTGGGTRLTNAGLRLVNRQHNA